MRSQLLLTGVGRSGTTLAEKVLHAHTEICMGSQPFPDLFLRAKEAYLADRGVVRPNPIGTRFLEADGTIEELAAFLDHDEWSSSRLDDLFDAMAANDGQYTKVLVGARGAVRPGRFFDVYSQLLTALAVRLGRQDAAWVGSKEASFEELAAIILDRGGAAVIMLRDPRDVLTSFHHGRGREFAGATRPTLFILRQWRKSVAFTIHLLGHPRFVAVRYEDLVSRPAEVVRQLAGRLAMQCCGLEELGDVVRDQTGEVWTGNSSFERHRGLSTNPVGRWRQHLDSATATYVDAVCGPELRALGYPAEQLTDAQRSAAIRSFREPVVVSHRRFSSDYSTSRDNVEAELRRLSLLRQSTANVDLSRWFIFPEVFETLGDVGRTPIFVDAHAIGGE